MYVLEKRNKGRRWSKQLDGILALTAVKGFCVTVLLQIFALQWNVSVADFQKIVYSKEKNLSVKVTKSGGCFLSLSQFAHSELLKKAISKIGVDWGNSGN